jgi:GTP pyrophosphokinase
MHVNIKAINVVGDDGIFDGEITLKVHNENFLNQVTSKLKKIEGIDEISRTYKHNKNIKI